MDDQQSRNSGWLPALSAGTLLVFYLSWAAGHDIAHGESDPSLEYTVLGLVIPAFAFLYRAALHLPARARAVWLGGTGLLVLLFDVAAIHVRLHPKYAPDPLMASAFLAAGVPALGFIAYDLCRALRVRTGATV